jgi:hypothetical protein
MHQLRKPLSRGFALGALVLLENALSIILGMAHRDHAFLYPRILFLVAGFLALAAIYGGAWWTAWKGRRSARSWGIAASLVNTLIPLLIIYFRHSIGRHFQVLLAVGIAGLVAFSRRYEQTDSAIRIREIHSIPGDGTNHLLNRSAAFLGDAAGLAALIFVDRWMRGRGISEIHGFWNGGIIDRTRCSRHFVLA